MADGRHSIETIFVFCTDGDRLTAEPAPKISLQVAGPFARDLSSEEDNLVLKAARALRQCAKVEEGAALLLDKKLPIGSGLGGGSADAAAALRLLTSLWRIGPEYAEHIAPELGSDVPACLLSFPARGEGAGDRLAPFHLPDLSGTAVLVVNPGVPLSTAAVYAGWDGEDRGSLGDWRRARNDLEQPAIALVPEIEEVLAWLRVQPGVGFVRMSGSGASCFALFESDAACNAAADAVPRQWWRLATHLR